MTATTMEREEDASIEHAVSKGGTIYAEAEQMKLTGLLIKRVRQLSKTIDAHGRATGALQQETNDLTGRIKTLTVWLRVLTVVILVLTGVMAWPGIMSVWESLRSAGR
jgi:hypothetical protein